PLVEDGPGVDSSIDQMQGGAGHHNTGGERIGNSSGTGEGWQQCCMGVDKSSGKSLDECLPYDTHQPRGQYDVRLICGYCLCQSCSPCTARVIRLVIDHKCRDVGLLCTNEPVGIVNVGASCNDIEVEVSGGHGVNNCLKIGPGTRK